MKWNEFRSKVAYTIEGIDRVFYKEELIPYKEEVNMKENKVDLPLKGELYDDNRIDDNVFCEAEDDFKSYEQAALAGIEYVINNLI